MPDHLPLSGVRVLDLTQVYAGPTCSRILCHLGASFTVTLSEAKGLADKQPALGRKAEILRCAQNDGAGRRPHA